MELQRKPTNAEREHLEWISEQVGKIQSLLDGVPHGIAMKITALTNEIADAVFDPFGAEFGRCESCEALLLDTDDFLGNEDGAYFCQSCVSEMQEKLDD